MRFLSTIGLTSLIFTSLHAQPSENNLWQDAAAYEVVSEPLITPNKPSTQFQAFAGRITKNRVRLRLQPNLDSPIIRELDRDDLLVIVGENEEFYAVKPPADTKGYIYRTFVLDGVIEGSRVNVRLEPDLDAPVIAQLKSGDKVQGDISALNSKWVEVAPPQQAQFYVCKEYIEKKGPPSLVEAQARRKDEVAQLFQETSTKALQEMQKAYIVMKPEPIQADFNTIINQFSDFPEEVEKSRSLQSRLQENYLQKKVAFLEAQQNSATNAVADATSTTKTSSAVKPGTLFNSQGHAINERMATWLPVENTLYEAWVEKSGTGSLKDFYEEQTRDSVVLTGIVEPYTRNIKNRPGDYMLVNQSNRLPIAFLYSTEIDLQELVGKAVSLKLVQRPNNHFAYPAYFALALD